MCYGFTNGFGPLGGFGGMGMMLGMIFHLAFAALIIYGLVKLFKRETGSVQINGHTGALETLKLRYAKGEMSDDEYNRIKKEIE